MNPRLLLIAALVCGTFSAAELSKIKAPYGSWVSEITSETLWNSESAQYSNLRYVEKTGSIFWIFNKTIYSVQMEEALSSPEPQITRWLKDLYNPISEVHEYGGAAMSVSKYTGFVYFISSNDNAIFEVQKAMSDPRRISSEGDKYRYADIFATEKFLYAIEEHHNDVNEIINRVVQFDISSGDRQVVGEGADFYTTPVVNDAGNKISWMQWDFPNMPWDATEIWSAEVHEGGKIENRIKILGDGTTNYMQPQYNGNQLHVISDQTDFWNVYKVDVNKETVVTLHNIGEIKNDIGEALWRLGQTNYQFSPGQTKGRVVLISKNTTYFIPSEGKTPTIVATGLTEFGCYFVHSGSIIFPRSDIIAMFGSSPNKRWRLQLVNVEMGNITVISGGEKLTPSELASTSIGKPFEFVTSEGMIAHAIFYEPKNAHYEAEDGTLPPLLTSAHEGPTSRTTTNYKPQIQYWTQKGFAILDMDYRGSTGYGRNYRDSLYGYWGVRDLDDIEYGVQHLIRAGKINVNQTAISGGSAGGFLTLRAMTAGKMFKAAVSKFGISDLTLLDAETHKFESQYLKQVIGDGFNFTEVLKERSPINYVDNIDHAIGFFHGDADPICPPNQAVIMHKAVKDKGLPTFIVMFKDEGHGFKKERNIKLSIDGEYLFYCKVFGIESSVKINDTRLNFENI